MKRHLIKKHWMQFFEQNYITEDDQVDIDWGEALFEDLFQPKLAKLESSYNKLLEQLKNKEKIGK